MRYGTALHAEAFAALDDRLPDVLLCDLDMPGESGLSLMRSLRARDPAAGGELPAAAITAHVRDEDARAAYDAGFQRYLAKPVEPLELACAVAELAAHQYVPTRDFVSGRGRTPA